LFECLLFGQIDDDRATAKIRDGCIAFVLPKKETGLWTQLESSKSGNWEGWLHHRCLQGCRVGFFEAKFQESGLFEVGWPKNSSWIFFWIFRKLVEICLLEVI